MTYYVAFVCGHNSGRSQAAEAGFNCLKTLYTQVDSSYEAISWGTTPGKAINPRVVHAMEAIGISLPSSKHFPKGIDHPSLQGKLEHVVRVYTMGCMDEACELPLPIPVKPEQVVDWGLDDPADPKTDVIAVRNKILGNCLELIVELAG